MGMMNQYSEVGLTAEQMADLTIEFVEILSGQLDIPACISEINKRHPEFTDEQRKALELDRTFDRNPVEMFMKEAFGDKEGFRNQLILAYEGPEPEKLEKPVETESVD